MSRFGGLKIELSTEEIKWDREVKTGLRLVVAILFVDFEGTNTRAV